MSKKEVEIEAVAVKDPNRPGLLYDKSWHTVVGNAAKFVGNIQKGKATIMEDATGNVVFVSQEKQTPPWQGGHKTEVHSSEDKPTNNTGDKITRMNTLKTAAMIVLGSNVDIGTSAAVSKIQSLQVLLEDFVNTGKWAELGDRVSEEDVR